MTAVIEGKTPEAWAEWFKSRMGQKISARRLREKAIALGACRKLGNAVIILPEHLDLIFETPEAKPCHSNSTTDAGSGGSRDASTTYRPANTTDKALAHLAAQARKKRHADSPSSKQTKSNVTTLASRGA